MTRHRSDIRDDRLQLSERFSVSFQRTLRIPDDGRSYPLPPGLGLFPLHRARDFAANVPKEWIEDDAVFLPMYQREALWLGFGSAAWKPNALTVAIGRVNAISGGMWVAQLQDTPQNYLVCPPQLWLDGINSEDEHIRQFVAMPTGSGHSIESQLADGEERGDVRLVLFEPRAGLFPDTPPPRSAIDQLAKPALAMDTMALGAGGRMRQKLYEDPYGIEAWDSKPVTIAVVHLVTTRQYEEITGRAPPATPIDAGVYASHGFPWFEIYDAETPHLPPPDGLSGVRSVDELDRERDTSTQGDASLDLDGTPIIRVQPGRPRNRKRDR